MREPQQPSPRTTHNHALAHVPHTRDLIKSLLPPLYIYRLAGPVSVSVAFARASGRRTVPRNKYIALTDTDYADSSVSGCGRGCRWTPACSATLVRNDPEWTVEIIYNPRRVRAARRRTRRDIPCYLRKSTVFLKPTDIPLEPVADPRERFWGLESS